MVEYKKIIFVFFVIVLTNGFTKESLSQNTDAEKFAKVDGTNIEYYIEEVSTEWREKQRHTYPCGNRVESLEADIEEAQSFFITIGVAKEIAVELGIEGVGIGLSQSETFQKTFGIITGVKVEWGDSVTLESCFETEVKFHVKVEKKKYRFRMDRWGFWRDIEDSFIVERIIDHKWEKIRKYSPNCDRDMQWNIRSVINDKGNKIRIRFIYPNSHETFIVPLFWDPHNDDVINPRKLLPERVKDIPNQ